ncbi:MAG: hypothetical protein ABWY80_01275 [Acidimicrobiia bacterium]
MTEQRWADNFDEYGDHVDELEIRHVHPYQAVKVYRCPGCDHEIPKGLGHEVVVPLASPQDRRHWHTACWRRAERHGR